MKLNEIPRNEHVKRAVEVAMAGKHSITLIGPYESEAGMFIEWVGWGDYPVDIYHMTPCPCGYFGSPTKECTCSLQMVKRHQGLILKKQTDMYIEVPLLSPNDIILFLRSTRKGEEDSAVYERVKLARKAQVPEMVWSDTDWNLLKGAAMQMQLSYVQVKSIIAVTKTIYKLSSIHVDKPVYSTAYLAEAIQYRYRKS